MPSSAPTVIDAGAADPGDQHVPGPIERRRRPASGSAAKQRVAAGADAAPPALRSCRRCTVTKLGQ